ncbi:SPOR domain-containing protein [Pseudopontixanthobacter vadosimaris]|uniref:SPOR domain-containing protein n=1 Tax=Pseudopontixanthobacter vadosimaris TaxID=2726450 RepID=UPI001F0FEFBF|nr:SPOR domain-containing protein [Pseudopontixanthobacter vadosimaris]
MTGNGRRDDDYQNAEGATPEAGPTLDAAGFAPDDYRSADDYRTGKNYRMGDDTEPASAYRMDDELALDRQDERLPWLESADDEEDAGGVDPARLIGFVLLALLALAVLIGGGWFIANSGGDGEIVADGSTIEAPDEPYRSRPDNPGGKEFAGTGDVAPAVAEGQTREGRIAEDDTPRPTVNVAQEADVAEPQETPEPALGGVAVQVGAYMNEATAESGWAELRSRTDLLNGVNHRIVRGNADIGVVYRLQAVAGDLSSARQLCTALKNDGVACQVKP